MQVIIDALSQKIQNVYNVLSGGGTAIADLDRIEAKFVDWLTNNWRLNVPIGVNTSLLILTDQSGGSALGREYVLSPTIAGAATGGLLPLHNTVAVKWGTTLTGRTHRGRTYHAGLVPSNLSGNQITTAHQTALVTTYTALLTKLAAGGTNDKLVVVSRCFNGAWRTDAVKTIITGCSVDINVDSQRRRLTGRGN